MNLTPEQLRQNAAAMIAFADGKIVQCRQVQEDGPPEWIDYEGTDARMWDLVRWIFRPKPEPKVRPWSKPEHVPFGCVLRSPSIVLPHYTSVCTLNINGLLILSQVIPGGDVTPRLLTWKEIQERGLEYSLDFQKWHPCTVEEPA